jgi:hypothetical protein
MSITFALLLSGASIQAPAAEFRFPTEPIGPAVVALGSTGVASWSDADAALNPASLTGAHRLGLHRFDGYAGYNGFVVAGGTQAVGPVAVGLAFRHFDYGKLVEDDLGPGTEDLDASERAFTFTTAARLPGRLRVGAAVSHLVADYFGSVTSATVLSLGGMLSYMKHGHLGVALRSIGGSATNADAGTRYRVPTRLRIGASQQFRVGREAFTVASDTELRLRGHTTADFHLGAQWSPVPPMALRAGFESLANPDVADDRVARWSAGVAFQIGPASLGIAARFGGSEGGEELFLGLDAF